MSRFILFSPSVQCLRTSYKAKLSAPRFHVVFSIELPLASPWRLPQPTVCKWINFPSCSSRDLQLSLSRIEAILATPRRFKLFILQCSVHYLYIIRKSNFFSTHKTICFKPQNISKKIFAPLFKARSFSMRLSYFIQSSVKTEKTLLPPPLSFSTHPAENFTPLMIPKKTFWKNNDSFLLKNYETGNKVSNRIFPYKKPSLTIISVALHGMFRNCFFPSRAPLAKYTISLETPPILPRLWRKIREAP